MDKWTDANIEIARNIISKSSDWSLAVFEIQKKLPFKFTKDALERAFRRHGMGSPALYQNTALVQSVPKTTKSANSPKIVTLDIETAPLESYHWGLWDQNIGLNQINVEWTILSFSAKWLGKKEVEYMDTGGRGAQHVRDDAKLLQRLWEILDEADFVITQNGKSFDIKKINTRLLLTGIKPYSPIKVIDTKIIAKKHFSFTSNRLEWMSEHITNTKKDKHKKFPGFELWEQCLKDNPDAWYEMKKYNILDTVATEELYLKLRPWIEGHPNMGVYSECEDMICPKCSSKNVQKRGKAYTQSGEYHRFQCTDCGGWARSRYTTNTKEKRHSLLAQ